MILVALVLRKAKGFDESCAADLTRTINEYIEINVNRPKIATNNMSRELRKEDILALPWLRFKENGRKPLFSLNEKWNKYWEIYFNKTSPDLIL